MLSFNGFRILLSAVFALTLLLVAPANANTELDKEKVIVYNWSDYIPQQILDSFTKETGIEVEYSTYDSNEAMYMRLKLLQGRGYDIIVPSTNIVSRMARDGLLQPLDFDQLENFKHLDVSLLNKSYDPGNQFSIPYLWGSTGIAVNTESVDLDQITDWSDLWHKHWRGKLVLLDEMRDVFHLALRAEGFSTNTSDADEIRQAYEKLSRLSPNIKTFSGSPLEEFANGNTDIGVSWNGDVFAAREDIPGLKYIYPKEGVGLWVDSFVIPARATNTDNAHSFINYMMRPEVAALCTEELGYATPNRAGRELLNEALRNNPTIFPPQELLGNSEFQQDVSDQALRLYQAYWDKIKAGE